MLTTTERERTRPANIMTRAFMLSDTFYENDNTFYENDNMFDGNEQRLDWMCLRPDKRW